MSFVKCFDAVTMVTDESTKRFAPIWVEDSEKKDILKNYCEAIDELAEEFDGETFDVEVDEIDMTISIKLECASSVMVDSQHHKLVQLANRSVRFGFSGATTESGNKCLSIEFVFPSIWERV